MEKVNCLWIGGKLSTMEKMALQSHLKVGHECHLWTYEDVKGVPDGIIVEDGRDILSEEDIFVYQVGEGKGSVSAFSNLFRYTLIQKMGGWWCDTDVICLKPFHFEEECVIASEVPEEGQPPQATTCVFKCPPQSELMDYCVEKAWQVDRETLEWGVIGPALLLEATIATSNQRYVRPFEDFCPVHWFDTPKIVNERVDVSGSFAVHLWNEVWRRKRIDKDGYFRKYCLYEKLKNDVLSNEERSYQTLPFV